MIISLKKRHEFAHVRQNGKKVVTKSFIIQACPAQEESNKNTPRFGFIVTKKIGNAVQRNRIKRRFRSLLQDQLKKENILPLDYVLIARPGCGDELFQTLGHLLEWAFKKYKTIFEKNDLLKNDSQL